MLFPSNVEVLHPIIKSDYQADVSIIPHLVSVLVFIYYVYRKKDIMRAYLVSFRQLPKQSMFKLQNYKLHSSTFNFKVHIIDVASAREFCNCTGFNITSIACFYHLHATRSNS